FVLATSASPRDPPPFPTRRSSDLGGLEEVRGVVLPRRTAGPDHRVRLVDEENDRRRRILHLFDQSLQAILELALHSSAGLQQREDRKSTRLNSSHVSISYAVFCLK